jgi:hypothetical protein
MNKKVLVFTLVAGLGYLGFSSYTSGPAQNGYDCTGAETGLGNPTGCGGGGCHSNSATANIGVTITVDSANSTPVTKYVGGMTYTVTISGINNGSTSLPKFGFQTAAITGSVAVSSPTNAGTWQQTGLPTGTHYRAAAAGNYVCNIVEHSTPNSATTGTGGTGTTYVKSYTWTAPAAGTGTVSIWGALNAVNGNNNNDANDLWNTNHVVLTEETATNAVANVTANDVKVYPNPVHGTLNIELANTNSTVNVYSLNGQLMTTQIATAQHTSINTGNWANGMYEVEIVNGNSRHISTIVKN